MLALPGPFGTSSTRAARRLSKGRARHAPGLLWEGNTKEREKQVFRFDGGGRQLQEARDSQELPEQGRLASASERAIARERLRPSCAPGWEPRGRGPSQDVHTRRGAQGLDECRDDARTHKGKRQWPALTSNYPEVGRTRKHREMCPATRLSLG